MGDARKMNDLPFLISLTVADVQAPQCTSFLLSLQCLAAQLSSESTNNSSFTRGCFGGLFCFSTRAHFAAYLEGQVTSAWDLTLTIEAALNQGLE